jgi:hypothetical protein
MVSLSAPHTRTDIGCIHSGSLWDSSGLVLIDSEWRLITISHVLIGSARCVTYRSQRQRCTSFFVARIYYEIRGRYYCLYRDSGGSLSTFFRYQDQRCLALFIREILSHRSVIAQSILSQSLKASRPRLT